jgi:hypothetical protein
LLLQLAGQLPLYLVWLLGLILAIVRWGRHPRVSSFVLLAVFIAAGTSLVGQAAFRLLPQLMQGASLPHQWYPVISIGMSILHAVAWSCMLLAAFSDRGAASSGSPFASGYDQPPFRNPGKPGSE